MQRGPLTCWVAVTGLAGCPQVPAIEVLLAVLAVWPGRVVTAVEAAPAVARTAEELLVEHAPLRVAAAVASCGQKVGGGGLSVAICGMSGVRANQPPCAE